jgi:succinyl-diaminopimelate desuccinylase
VNLARIIGGDVLNRVPDRCTYDLDIRYLPGQDPKEIARQIRSVELPAEVEILFGREPTYVSRANPYVKTLREVAARHFRGNPVGGGHHGPSEYVVTDTLEAYRQMIVQFVQIVGRNGKSR